MLVRAKFDPSGTPLDMPSMIRHVASLHLDYTSDGYRNLQNRMQFMEELVDKILQVMPEQQQRALLPFFALEEVVE